MKNHWLAKHLAAFAAIAFLVLGMLAAAGTPVSAAGGDNGDIKVHQSTTPATDLNQKSEPQLGCGPFYLQGFGFDSTSSGNWQIIAWEPTGDNSTVVLSGTWGDSTVNGEWHTPDQSLANGHYKLTWKQNGSKNQKFKTFWVRCEETPPQVCTSDTLTLSVTGAGKSDPALARFASGNWTITFHYSGAATGTIPGVRSGSGPYTFTGVGSITPPVASVDWGFTVDQVNPAATIFDSHTIGNVGFSGFPDCAGSDSAISPVSDITLFKALDLTGHGGATDLDAGLAGFTFTATSGTTVLHSGATDSNGGAQIAGLDELVPWTICEDAQDGYVQTTPANGCYTLGAGATPAIDYVFGNFKTVDLTVTKDATGAFTRTFDWTVTKSSSDAPKITQNGGTATIHYTVTATKDAGTDSNFGISGTITITNPNPIAVTLTGLTDSIANCSFTAPASVAAFEPGLTVTYSCPLPDATATSAGANTATVTWSNTGAMAQTTGSASNDPTCTNLNLPCAKYDFATVTPTLVNNSVTVTDPLVAGTLGTPTATTSYTPTYSQQVPGPGYCTTVTNTATVLDGSSPKHSASVNVDVCGQALTRTLGYWGSHTNTANTQWNNKVLGTVAGLAAFNSWRANSTSTAAGYNDDNGQIDTNTAAGQNELMGCFLSNISKKADGKTARLAIDQSRMQLAQQLCAALLNKYALGMNDNGLVATAIANYNSSNASLILASVAALDAFNNSGNTTPFAPATTIVDVSSTSSASTTQANLKFWDVTLKP